MIVSSVPFAVRLKVALYGLAGLAVVALPWWIWPGLHWGSLVWSLACLATGLYAVWCFWPRWDWGFGYDTRALLPTVDGQRFRLTFDDGPTPGLTDRVLDILSERGIRASFFVLVSKARLNPGLIRRIVDDGHWVGLHGEDHRTPFRRSTRDLRESLAGALAELEAIAGQPVTLYRPSHGWKNLALVRALSELPLKACHWHYGVWDTDAPPADVLVSRLKAVTPTSDDLSNPIILLHDGLDDDPAVPAHAATLLESLSRWLPVDAS